LRPNRGRVVPRLRSLRPNRTHPSGATVPITLEPIDSAGRDFFVRGIVVTVAGLSPATAPETVPSGSFTCRTASCNFNELDVETKNLPASTYQLSFTAAGDPTMHMAAFVVVRPK
jgi:hypothetical protein